MVKSRAVGNDELQESVDGYEGTQEQLPQMQVGKMYWKPPLRNEIEDYCLLMAGYFRNYV